MMSKKKAKLFGNFLALFFWQSLERGHLLESPTRTKVLRHQIKLGWIAGIPFSKEASEWVNVQFFFSLLNALTHKHFLGPPFPWLFMHPLGFKSRLGAMTGKKTSWQWSNTPENLCRKSFKEMRTLLILRQFFWQCLPIMTPEQELSTKFWLSAWKHLGDQSNEDVDDGHGIDDLDENEPEEDGD